MNEEDDNIFKLKSTDEIESEIRRLKLELIKQQYDDKILSLKSIIESNKKLNKNNNTVNILALSNATDSDDFDDTQQLFGSVLFANIYGDFEVWHCVLLTLIVWVLLLILINCLKKKVSVYKAEKRRKLRVKLMKQQIVHLGQNSNIDQLAQSSCEQYETESLSSYDSSQSSKSSRFSSSNLQIDQQNENSNNAVENSVFEFNFQLPKRDFFLYTIEEHSKTFNNKKFSIKRKLITNLSHLSSLSKSEPVLAQDKQRMKLKNQKAIVKDL